MEKKIGKALFVTFAVMILLTIVGLSTAFAETEGCYTYTVENGTATIVNVDADISGDVIIPSKLGGYPVISIGQQAFEYCVKIDSVVIPDCLVNIGNYAFNGCLNVKNIEIPNSVENIGQGAFEKCESLLTIVIPDSVISLGAYAFRQCESLTDIELGENVKSIGNYAFEYCSNLKSIIIPNSTTNMGYRTFANCTNLANVYVSNSISTISDYTFYKCINLATINIPNSITSIGYKAFYNCQKLDNLNIPESVTSIGEYAFCGCQKLTNIVLPNSLTTISNWVFDSCSELSTVEIPNSVTSIGGSAFSNCNIASITIPDSVISIGDYAFFECSNLKSITIPNSVTSIGFGAFYNCTSLASVTIGNSVTSIDDDAFSKCYSITSIIIPNSVTSIGCMAFAYCENLESIVIGKSVTRIGADIFHDCTNLKNVYFTGTKEQWDNIDISLYYDDYLTDAIIHYNYCEHKNYQTIEASDSTCSTIGYTASVYCNDCEEYISGHMEIEINTDAHKWDNGTITTVATCNVNGIKTYTCKHNENHTYTEDLGIDENNHGDTRNIEAVIPTCSAAGYTAGVYCNDCEEYISGHKEIGIDANAHKWDNGTITISATCKVNGVKTYTCEYNENHTYTEDLGIDENNHIDTKNTEAVIPTCSSVGYTAGVYCNDCEEYISGHEEILIDETAHKWDNSTITTIATCRVNGVKTYTCAHNKNHTYTEDLGVNKNNHNNIKNTEAVIPTCSSVGYTAGVYCNDCEEYISGHEEIGIDINAHSYSATVTSPTCITAGYTTYCCDICQEVYIANDMSELGHDMGCVIVEKQVSCTQSGFEISECSRCDYSEVKDILATGHNYQDGVCVNCGDAESDNCICNCHKTGVIAIIWKIIRFFYKFFEINKACACGVSHY